MDAQPSASGEYDGNSLALMPLSMALAGPLSEVFAVDVTTAVARCRGCGRSAPVATLTVYGPEPGLVGRCPGCLDVLVRLVRTPDALWVDLSGMTALRVPLEGVDEP